MNGGVIDKRILMAFSGVVILAGSNIVAVRFSNRELDPFWGAGIRFLGASLILWALVARGRYPLPQGRALGGAFVYGILSFLIAYAFFYWGSQEVPAGLGGTIMAAVPLLTVMFAAAHRLERLRLRGVVGAVVALTGIAIMSSGALAGDVSLVSVLAVVVAAAAASESGIVLKLLPSAHPVVTNAIGMSVGAVLLLLLSSIAGESWSAPESPSVWAAIVYLAIASPFLHARRVRDPTMDSHRRELPVRPVPDRLRDRGRAPAGRGGDLFAPARGAVRPRRRLHRSPVPIEGIGGGTCRCGASEPAQRRG